MTWIFDNLFKIAMLPVNDFMIFHHNRVCYMRSNYVTNTKSRIGFNVTLLKSRSDYLEN